MTIDKHKAVVTLPDTNATITAPRHGNLYVLQQGSHLDHDIDFIEQQQHAYLAYLAPASLWHKRMGHIGKTNLTQLVKAVKGGETLQLDQQSLQAIESGHGHACRGCVFGKLNRSKFARESSAPAPSKILEMVVADVLSIQNKYVSAISDVYSRIIAVKIVNTKDEATQHVMDWITWAQTQTGHKVKHFHTDGGGEYISNALKQFLVNNGTTNSATTRDTPQHNGIIERFNRTLLEMTRAMLHFADLPIGYWESALHTAVYIINRCVPRSLQRQNINKTRIEVFFGHKPSIDHMRTFGCNVYMHLAKKYRQGKMDKTSLPCVFIGYYQPDLLTPPYYMVYDPLRNKTYRTRDCTFDEFEFTIGRKNSNANREPIHENGQSSTQHQHQHQHNHDYSDLDWDISNSNQHAAHRGQEPDENNKLDKNSSTTKSKQ